MWKSPPHVFHEPSAAAQVSVTLPGRLRDQEVQIPSTKLHTHHRHFNTSCSQAQRTQHPLTSGEDLLSLRFSSANNLGVKVLQEVLESFKLCSHGDYCLISEWRSRGCSQEQELDVLNSDLEDFHPCISVFGVHWPCKKKHWRLKRKAGLAAFWNPASFPQLSFAPQWQQWGQGSGEPSHYHTRSWACTAAPESPNRNVPPNSPNSSQERLFCSAAWILLLSLGIIIQRAK